MANDTTLVVSGTTFVEIATAYAKIKYRLDTAVDYLLDAVNYILDTDELYPTVDLLNSFYQTYLINSTSLNAATPYIGAVKTLNNHVLSRGGYTDIDTFLETAAGGPYTVPVSWATLSAQAGQTISSGNQVPDAF